MASHLVPTAALGGIQRTSLMLLPLLANESKQKFPLFRDDTAEDILRKLDYNASDDARKRMSLTKTIPEIVAVRAWWGDGQIREHLQWFPKTLVVDLGSGLDTRYFRVTNRGELFKDSHWMLVDLPDQMQLWRDTHMLVSGTLPENVSPFASSVTDISSWVTEATKLLRANNCTNVLFVSTGCFTYIDRPEVMTVFKAVIDHFPASQFIYNTIRQDVQQRSSGRGDTRKFGWTVMSQQENPLADFESSIKLQTKFSVIGKCFQMVRLRSSDTEFAAWKSTVSELMPNVMNYTHEFGEYADDLGYNMHHVYFK